jgi:hypothetical protein
MSIRRWTLHPWAAAGAGAIGWFLAQVALWLFVFEGPFTFADLLLAAGLALLLWLTLGVLFKYLAERSRKKEAK